MTNWEISIKKNDKINSLSIKTKTNCQDLPKISGLRITWSRSRLFVTRRWCWDKTEISRLSRPTLCQCQDRDKSRPPCLHISQCWARYPMPILPRYLIVIGFHYLPNISGLYKSQLVCYHRCTQGGGAGGAGVRG